MERSTGVGEEGKVRNEMDEWDGNGKLLFQMSLRCQSSAEAEGRLFPEHRMRGHASIKDGCADV